MYTSSISTDLHHTPQLHWAITKSLLFISAYEVALQACFSIASMFKLGQARRQILAPAVITIGTAMHRFRHLDTLVDPCRTTLT